MLNMLHPAVDLGIVCSDFDDSLQFYRDFLGFEEVLDIQIPADVAVGAKLAPGKFRQVRLQAGHTLIKLMEIDSPPEERSHAFQSGVRWLTFIVENVPELVEKLKVKGVQFMAEMISAPDAKHVVCAKGPDGMLIELVQLYDRDLPL
ncbi:MAG: VOC family protein [Pirellulaceae bacterium]|nr:VOC family protein [Pirellulaceae bacterium]